MMLGGGMMLGIGLLIWRRQKILKTRGFLILL